ncbi:hypothetical protein LZC95_20010 [Pendulispora brunnea]|uniref:Uncharacterized protein n=1 Tax=Pendulispora brunnea TaxID=2905690 RepID=A0ABZ2KPW1_9BACT
MDSGLDIALGILEGLVKLVPEFGDWLAVVTHGKSDPVTQRVRDILPEESLSAAARRELED